MTAALSDISNQVCAVFRAARVDRLAIPPATRPAMLVCQRNISTEVEIREVVLSFLRQDPWAIAVPAKVYREFDKRRSAAAA